MLSTELPLTPKEFARCLLPGFYWNLFSVQKCWKNRNKGNKSLPWMDPNSPVIQVSRGSRCHPGNSRHHIYSSETFLGFCKLALISSLILKHFVPLVLLPKHSWNPNTSQASPGLNFVSFLPESLRILLGVHPFFFFLAKPPPALGLQQTLGSTPCSLQPSSSPCWNS